MDEDSKQEEQQISKSEEHNSENQSYNQELNFYNFSNRIRSQDLSASHAKFLNHDPQISNSSGN